MRIPKLNLRKKRGRKSGSPLKYDSALVDFLSRLQKINDYDSFETWRKDFLERLGYFLVDEGIEKSGEAYHVRLRVKVDKLVRIISKIAHHVNDGNLSSAQLTKQARNSLDDGMKSCEDISTYLKVLLPLTVIDESIVGFTKYNISAVLVETGFKEYERLNMCRDILQVLRENFVNSVAEPQHVSAFKKFDQEMTSFKSVLLEDVGVLPVLQKQRQLKSPDPPKALIAEIRRGVLREALISKSLKAKQAAQANKNSHEILNSNLTITKPKFVRNKVDRMENEIPPGTEHASADEIVDPKVFDPIHSIVDIKQDRRSALQANPINERNKTKRRKKMNSKSPLRRRPTTNFQQRSLKQTLDTHETKTSQSLSRQRKNSRNPKHNSKTNLSSSRRRGVKDTAFTKDNNGEGISKRVQTHSSRNRLTPLKNTRKSKSNTSRELIRQEKGLSSSYSHCTKQAIAHDKIDSLVLFSKTNYPSKGILSEDDNSTSSVYRKNMSKIKSKRARKGKQSLKNSIRERNIVTTTRRSREAFHTKDFSTNTILGLHDTAEELFETKGEDNTYENLSQEATVAGNVPRSSKGQNFTRNARHQKNEIENRARIGSMVVGLQLESGGTSNQKDSFGLGNNTKFTKESINELFDEPVQGTYKKKKIVSKSLKQKKNSVVTDDYKKIIHRKAYSAYVKKELPKLNIKWPFPVLVSEDIYLQEASTPTENNPVGHKFEKLQVKSGEKTSSNLLSSLLDNFNSLSCDEVELNQEIQYKTSNKESDLFQANNGKFQRHQPLLGHLGSKSVSASFNHGNVHKKWGLTKSVGIYSKKYFENPSFYENFVKPLTMIEHNSTDENEGQSFSKDEGGWEGVKDVFEDSSVCSSRYLSGGSSFAEAIAKFNSEESIIELQRLNEIGNKKDEAIEIRNKGGPETRSSSTAVTRSDNQLEDGIAEPVERIEGRNLSTRGAEEIKIWNQFGTEHDFFENSEEYHVYDRTKEILTAEEEAARMAEEVANLQIALENNQYLIDCTCLDSEEEEDKKANDEGTSEDKLLTNWDDLDDEDGNEATDEGVCKIFGEEDENLEVVDHMLKLKASKDKVPENSTVLDDEEDKVGECIELEVTKSILDLDGSENELLTSSREQKYFREGIKESTMMKKMFNLDANENKQLTNHPENNDKGEELLLRENVFKLKTIENKVLRNCKNHDDKEKEENKTTKEDTWHFREVSEALGMVENMLELEDSNDQVLTNCTDFGGKEEKGNNMTDECEDLERKEKMLKLQSIEDEVLNEEVRPSGCFEESPFEVGGTSSVRRNSDDNGKNLDTTSMSTQRAMDGVATFNSKHGHYLSTNFEYSGQPNPTISSKRTKKLGYTALFSLHSNDIISTSQLGKSPKGKGSLTLVTSKQTRKN